MQESYTNGKRSQKTVAKTAWAALGFNDGMTHEQARARAHQLNNENAVRRQEQSALARIASRIEKDRLYHSVFIPEDLNQQFIKWLDENVTGNETHRQKIRIHWSTAKKMLIGVMCLPHEYAANKKQFYRYITTQEYSLDYAKKLLRMVNLYGQFTARLTGKYYEHIPRPRGHDREMINDAYIDSDSYFGPSESLTPETLNQVKDALKQEQWKWLFCTVWLGLRPSELDQIMEDRKNQYWRVEEGETDVLWVYQPKLTSKPRPKRWKPIPILYPEQKEALGFVFEGGAAKPLAKTIKKYTGQQITLYGGRKGFTDLMLGRGQRLEDIAQWLGHSSIEMTWTKYKDKTRVGFTITK